MSTHAAGDKVRLWKPGHAEHGAYGTVGEVAPYDGPAPAARGPDMYRVQWTWRDGQGGFVASLPDCMVMSEADWERFGKASVR